MYEGHRAGNLIVLTIDGFHSLGAHRHAITDGHSVELHGRAASRPDALFHLDSQVAQVVVTGHRFSPGVGHANDRASQVAIGKTDAFEHSPRTCTVAPIGDYV